MVHTDIVDISDDSTKFCVSWVLCRVLEYGLKMFVNSWSHHTIPSAFLLIGSKISIKRNPNLYLKRGCLFYVFVASMSLTMEFQGETYILFHYLSRLRLFINQRKGNQLHSLKKNNSAVHLPVSRIPTCAEAVDQHQQLGGRLKHFSSFGTDPLKTRTEGA